MHNYEFRIIARTEPNTEMGVGVTVTVSVLAGSAGHISLCGTLTMTEPEWETMADALTSSLGETVQIVDHSRHGPSSAPRGVVG